MNEKKKQLTEETKQKISEALKGRVFTEEHRRNKSLAQIGRVLSDETKERIRQKALERGPTGDTSNRKEYKEVDGVFTKHCSTCEGWKLLDEFHKNSRRWDGLNYACKECHKANRRNYYNNNEDYRQKAIRKRVEDSRRVKGECIEYLGSKCVKCGFTYVKGENESGFDFHHRDPSQKDFAISEKKSAQIESIKPELDKCDLLCCMCHRLYHQKEWAKNGRS